MGLQPLPCAAPAERPRTGHLGYRRAPYGIRARLCNSELTDLAGAEELILRDDGPNGDLGYPNAIQLDNGDILVTYYISGPDGIRTIDVTRLRED